MIRTIYFFALVVASGISACQLKDTTKTDTAVAPLTSTFALSKSEITTTTEKTFAVNPKTSLVHWRGTKTGGEHIGTIRLQSGSISLKNGNISGGEFVLDMTSLANSDLTGSMKGDLEGHLKTGDFFEVETYPTATFTIEKASLSQISGTLMLKGIRKKVSFPLKVKADDQQLTAQTATFNIRRSDWGISYQSKMKDIAIHDEISLCIGIAAN